MLWISLDRLVLRNLSYFIKKYLSEGWYSALFTLSYPCLFFSFFELADLHLDRIWCYEAEFIQIEVESTQMRLDRTDGVLD